MVNVKNKNFIISIVVFIRRQIEKNKLSREKQLREAAEREKAAMEQRLLQYQEEIRLANEALVSVYLHNFIFQLFEVTSYKFFSYLLA